MNNITIVGGGSAGWMTAATLLNQFPDKKITLVESPTERIIGVGESTIAGGQGGFAGIINWLRLVNIDDHDFMPHCDAVYKLSIAFENWYRKDSGTFHYPFGDPILLPEIGLNIWNLKKILHPETPISDYAECFYPAMAFVNQNKLFLEKERTKDVQHPLGVSYQFDATKFGIWLRDNYCKAKYSNNFTHILAEVNTEFTPMNDDGIKHLILDNGQKLEADLFIDCTGFKSLLLSELYDVPFESIEKYIPNNFAWATKIPYKDPETQIVNYTKCTAIQNGWTWEIPLWSRMGSGYVFSDKFISTEEALEDFQLELLKKGYENVDDLEYHLIPMRCGIQSKLWIKNTCAIGLSAGFIEPLQSNGLHSIYQFIFNLCRTLERGHISEWDRREFTAKCHDDFYGFAAIVALSYSLSHRDDSEYWKEIQNREWSPELFAPSVSDRIARNLNTAFIDKNFNYAFNPQNSITACMAVGMNWNPIDIHSIKYNGININDYEKSIQQIEKRKKLWNEQVKDYPSPYQYLKNIRVDK